MSALVFKDLLAYIGGGNFSTSFNSCELDNSAELLDATTFDSGNVTRKRAKGLSAVNLSYNGFWEGTTDKALFDAIGEEVGDAYTVVPDPSSPPTSGDVAYFFEALSSQYNPGGAVGELFAFTINAEAAGQPLVRGVLATLGEEQFLATGVSQAVDLGLNGSRFYAAVHVIGIDGSADSTLDVAINSDDEPTFTGGNMDSIGPQILGTDSPQGFVGVVNADPTFNWARLAFTIAGTSPDFTIIGFVGRK